MNTLKPNILFFVIDSFRADKCFGDSKTSITPNLDNLQKNGISFTQTISTVATTIPSLGSIFTSKFPNNVGLSVEKFEQLNLDSPTYLQIFKKNGYDTNATMPEIASDFGLTCDFKNDDSSYDNYFGLFDGLGDKILQKLSSNNFKTPWFLYIHLFDLHTPIILPSEFDDKQYGESNYEKMISAIDHWIGKIINKVDLENTLIILTADHGEYVPVIHHNNEIINFESGIGESKLWLLGNKVPPQLYPLKKKFGFLLRKMRKSNKKSKLSNLSLSTYEKRVMLESRMSEGHRMFDDLLHVPLIISGPSLPENKVIKTQVRQVDIFPTIADIIGIEPISQIDGTSLLPLINDKDVEELPAYIESPPTITGNLKKVIGIRTSKYKFLKSSDETKNVFELYDLQNDPLEENNIVNTQTQIVTEMESILMQIGKKSTKNNESMDAKKRKIVRDNLRKLGYV
jgi:arylsulfatase A-like enzyme